MGGRDASSAGRSELLQIVLGAAVRPRRPRVYSLQSAGVRTMCLCLAVAFALAGCSARPQAPARLEVRVPQYTLPESFPARIFHEYAAVTSRLRFDTAPVTNATTVELFARGAADAAV